MSYAPARWLPGPHAMTVFASLARWPLHLSPAASGGYLDDGDLPPVLDIVRVP